MKGLSLDRGKFLGRRLRYCFAILGAMVFSLGQMASFADQPGSPHDLTAKHQMNAVVSNSTDSFEIISPESGQPQISSQKVTVSDSQLISLDYTNADLTDILKAISYSFNINIIITKNLSGKITAKLKNFTLDDALNAILGVHNYGFMRKGGIVYVVPKDDLDQTTESLPLSFLTLKEAETLLKGVKSKFSGTIQENEDSNALVVTAIPSDMVMIKEYLKGIDVPPLQVMIDAEIVSISKNDSKNIGSTINVNYNPTKGVGVTLLGGDGAANSNTNNNTTSNNGTTGTTGSTTTTTGPTGTNLTNAVQGLGSGSDSGIFGLSGNWRNVSPSIAVNALITQNKARVIASPSIAALNGHEASILIGEQYPYTVTTSTAGGTSGSVNQTQTQYIDIGTKLKVTPIVSPDGWITLKVSPEVSSFNGVASNGNPIVSTSTADTEVRVRDNETIVIGGLDSRNMNNSNNGTPGLMNIPVLGWLFKHDTSTVIDGTLTVLITPHIVSMPQAGSVDYDKTVPNQSFLKGNDSSLIEMLLQNADSLEEDKTKDSAKNLYISAQQVKTYREILTQFPQSGRTDYCLYKIAFIYGKDFGNCAAAQEALTEMKDFFPQSPYMKVTETFVNACIAVNERGDRK